MGKHIHHIIPRHAGGSDDPSNLVELSVEEHAEAHRILFEQNGAWQDYMAWKCLSGQVKSDDVRRLLTSLAWKGKKHTDETIHKIKTARQKQVITEETRQKMSQTRKGRQLHWDTKAHTHEANQKRSNALKNKSKQKVSCPHCGKTGGQPQMIQWHFDRCKEKR